MKPAVVPIVFIIDDDRGMRQAVQDLVESVGPPRRRRACRYRDPAVACGMAIPYRFLRSFVSDRIAANNLRRFIDQAQRTGLAMACSL